MAQAVHAMHIAGEPAPRHWTDVVHLVAHVCHMVSADASPAVRSVLVKGSRFMRMERVVQGLQALDMSAGNTHIKDFHAA
jgi:UDP-N-acetylmuramoyl-tripeptide--D-alanyl-D-alanine ligase